MGLLPHVAPAQSGSVWAPRHARPAQPVSFFVEWEEGHTFDAIRVRLPNGWDLLAVREVDDTRLRQTAMRLRPEGDEWIAEARFRIATPLRVVVTALPDKRLGDATVEIQAGNLVPARKGLKLESVGEGKKASVVVEESRPAGGHALRLESAGVLRAALDADPARLPTTSSFAVEFWLQTVALDAIILSTWDGNEAGSYPFEFVIDAGGNLRCYSGLAGTHFSLVSTRPLADGEWHHIAYVRDADTNLASLYVDGRKDDSVFLADQGVSVSYPIALGGRVGSNALTTSGLIDEVRVWSHARSADAIVAGARLPGRGLSDRPAVVLDFESPLPASIEGADILVASDLALHQPVRDARAEVKTGGVEIAWRLTSAEAQTVTLERSEDGSVFLPIYLVVAGARDAAAGALDRGYSFTDVDVDGSTVFYYRFTQDFADGSRLVSNTLKLGLGDAEAPKSFELIGNSPNPFVHSTQVFFELTERMHVRLSVWDISGHLVDWLVNATLEPGRHFVPFTADDLPSGTYFVRMESEGGVETRKMILSK